MKFISVKSDDKEIDRNIMLLTMVNRLDLWLPWFLEWAPSPETWVQPSANMACDEKKKQMNQKLSSILHEILLDNNCSPLELLEF